MASAKEKHTPREAFSSLRDDDKRRAERLSGFVISLGYRPKISALGEKADEWKCEYILKKETLLIIKISGEKWSARCKLFNLPEYSDLLEKANKHCAENLLANSKPCGKHGGGCKGPLSFSFNGREYTKCRHSLLFDDISDEDAGDIEKLLRRQAESAGS